MGGYTLMKDKIIILGMCAVMVLLFGVGIWWTTELWAECRETHSWLWCVKVLSK